MTDIQTVEVTSDAENVEMEVIAKSAAEILSKAYANHWWMVGWAPGMNLVIKHGMGDNRFGYSLHVPSCHSASDFGKQVIRGGGELLERMGLPRGAWNGDDQAQQYDGAEEHGPNRVRH